MKRLLLFCLLGTTLVGLLPAQKAPATSGNKSEAAVISAVTQVVAAFNDRGPVTLLFTKDADYVDAQGVWIKGIDEIEPARQHQFATDLKAAHATVKDVKVRLLKPDVAIAHVTCEVSGMLSANQETLPPHNELSTLVLVKQKGKWLVASVQEAHGTER
ncbi:MAG: SgcJ/EcaC family oxidoreductase [Acidobacteriales bacterium]|nr:SgcJ/EcaC family oxidoreductase [Terriglobales bacterium]